jgi:hypothetical protein
MTAREQIVAVCRNGRTRQRIAILDLPLPSPFLRQSPHSDAYERRFGARNAPAVHLETHAAHLPY